MLSLLWARRLASSAGACFLDLSRGGLVYSSCRRAGEELGWALFPLGSETVSEPFGRLCTRRLIDSTAQSNFAGVLVPYSPLTEKHNAKKRGLASARGVCSITGLHYAVHDAQ